MTKKNIVVVDTSALVFLLTGKSADEEPEVDRRRLAVRAWIEENSKGSEFAIPAVVVAELTQIDADSRFEELAKLLGRLRILTFTHSAGKVAAKIWCNRSKPGITSARNVVKFDTLICATAIEYSATHILTENARDFRGLLGSVGSSIEVVAPSQPPERGQANIFQIRRSST